MDPISAGKHVRSGLAGQESTNRVEAPGFGHYELLERVGLDDLVETYRAHSVGPADSERPVTFKRILPEILKEPGCRARLASLAQRMEGLSHANIVEVLRFGQLPQGWCLVTEEVAGASLRMVLATLAHQARPTRIPLGLYIGQSICTGLAFAHRHRATTGDTAPVVHEGVCPDAVLISREGLVKLTDFGLAALRPTRQRVAYWAPEQARGEPADPRSDVFGAGAVLYECLTGRPAFAAADVPETLARVERGSFFPPQQLNPLISEPLAQIVDKALAVDPAARYQSAGEMAQAIELYGQLEGVAFGASTLASWMKSARLAAAARRAAVESLIHDAGDTIQDSSPHTWVLGFDGGGTPDGAAEAGATTPWDEALISAGSSELATAAEWMSQASAPPASVDASDKETVPAPVDEVLAELTLGLEEPQAVAPDPVFDELSTPLVVSESPLAPPQKPTQVQDPDPALLAVVRGGEQADTVLAPGHEQSLHTGDIELLSSHALNSLPGTDLGRQLDVEAEEWITERRGQRPPALAAPVDAHQVQAAVQPPPAATPYPAQQPPRSRLAWIPMAALVLSLVMLVATYLGLYLHVRDTEQSATNTGVGEAASTPPTNPGVTRRAVESDLNADRAAVAAAASTTTQPHEPPATRPGYLVVTTNPPLAEVRVDGRPTGRMTPVTKSAPLLLSSGHHRITLATEGRSVDVAVEIETGHTVHIFRELAPPP